MMNTCQPTCLRNVHKFTHPSFGLGWVSMSAKRLPARGSEETVCYGKHTPFSSFKKEGCMLGQASWETQASFKWGCLDHNQLHLSSQIYDWNQPPLPYFMAHQIKIPTSLAAYCRSNKSTGLVLLFSRPRHCTGSPKMPEEQLPPHSAQSFVKKKNHDIAHLDLTSTN